MLGLFEFGHVGGVLEDALLDWGDELLDYLTHAGLHLEPLELLYLEFLVLVHSYNTRE